MSNTTENLIQTTVDAWLVDEAKFAKGNKAAGTRARKHLAELMKLAKARRAEIQEVKSAE